MPALDTLLELNALQEFDESHRQFILDNWIWFQDYLDKNVNPGWLMSEHRAQIKELYELNPLLGRKIFEDWITPNDEKIDTLLDMYVEVPGMMALILGQVGQGKTAFGLWLLEKLHYERSLKVCMLQTTLDLPPFIKQYENPLELPEGHVAFIDEASLTFNAR